MRESFISTPTAFVAKAVHCVISPTHPDLELVHVDNGSTDDSLVRLRPHIATYPLTQLDTGHSLGYARGNNVGTPHALEHGVDFVLVPNNDTTVARFCRGRAIPADMLPPGSWVQLKHDVENRSRYFGISTRSGRGGDLCLATGKRTGAAPRLAGDSLCATQVRKHRCTHRRHDQADPDELHGTGLARAQE